MDKHAKIVGIQQQISELQEQLNKMLISETLYNSQILDFNLVNLKNWLNMHTDMAFVIDSNYKVLEVNDMVCTSLGLSLGEIQQRNCFDVIHGCDAPCDECNSLLNKLKIPLHTEFFNKKLSRWFQMKLSPIQLTGNDESYYVAILHDITELKKTQELLENEKDNFQLLIDKQSDLLVKVDAQGKFLFVNSPYCKLFGKNQDELLGSAFMPLVHEEDRKATEDAMQNLQKPPYTAYMEQRALTAHGWRWLAWNDSALLDNEGNIKEIIGVGRDITEQKEYEIALKRSESKFRVITQNPYIGIVWASLHGDIIDCNEAFCNMVQYSKSELTGISYTKITVPEDLQTERRHVDNLVTGKIKYYNIDKRYIRKDSQVIWVNITVSTNKDDKGNISNLIGIIQEISEKVEYREQLQESNDTKDKFFSILAHDLKNPMAQLVSYSELLQNEAIKNKNEQISKYAEVISRSSNRINDMLDELLIWSRAQMGKIVLNPQPINILMLIEKNVHLLREMTDNKGIKIKIASNVNKNVFADLESVNIVLRNLLTNAIKFTPNEGVITVKTSLKTPHQLLIEIEDSGVGITAEKLESIFSLNSDDSTTGTKSEKGTGLGLNLCKEFVELNKGQIGARSELCEGSTFYFTLPTLDSIQA
jgi:PAS domain S-box-containing protein